jgi:hypothetical protein
MERDIPTAAFNSGDLRHLTGHSSSSSFSEYRINASRFI